MTDKNIAKSINMKNKYKIMSIKMTDKTYLLKFNLLQIAHFTRLNLRIDYY